jgi:CRISPR-associated protein Cst1
MENVNKDWLTATTGDPFSDVGGIVIQCLWDKRPGKSLMDLIKEATDIYVWRWDNNLHSFFLNSTITHNSNKGEKGARKTVDYFSGLLNDVNAEVGYCRITGQKGKVFPGARENQIMSGSATLINFHHGFESGLKLSKEALIRMFFLPLGVEQLGDKVALLISNDPEVTDYFVRRNVDLNLKNLAHNMSKSVLKSEFANPANALFDYAGQCIDNLQTALFNREAEFNELRGITLNLFHFTNFGANPTISLYSLPSQVFAFYAYCISRYKKDWNNFIYRQYHSYKVKEAQFDAVNQTWYNSKETAGYEIFKTWNNPVFKALLNNDASSMRRAFLRHSKTYVFNFNIVELYQIIIQNMNKKTLTKIKEVADFIVDDRSDDDIKKLISGLNKAKKSGDLRYFLLKLVNENYVKGNEEPLFSLDDYVEYLFPDGTYWNEIRDLLLIAIYQKLHAVNKKIATELFDESETENN